jgi:hypothetical protein
LTALAVEVLLLTAAVAERAGVARVVQQVQHAVVRERCPNEVALLLAGMDTLWEQQAPVGELADGRACRAGALEGLEQKRDRGADGEVRIEGDLSERVVGESDRQRRAQLAAAGF